MDTCSNGESGIVFNVKLSDLRSDDLKKDNGRDRKKRNRLLRTPL